MPVLATFFSVRRGRDPFFKFFMQKVFPRQVQAVRGGVRHAVPGLVQRGLRLGLRQRDPAGAPRLRDDRSARSGRAPRAGSATVPGSGCSSAITRCSCASAWAPTSNSTPSGDPAYHEEQSTWPSMLGEIAAEAAIERTTFLVDAADQLERFLKANAERIRELGGLVLIDDDPDYLSIAPDSTFRSRTRYQDEATGEWVTETEVIETRRRAGRAVQPRRDLRRVRGGGPSARPACPTSRPAPRTSLEVAGICARRGVGVGVGGSDPYVGAATTGRPAQRGARGTPTDAEAAARLLRPGADLPGAQPADRGAPASSSSSTRVRTRAAVAGRPDDPRRRRRAPLVQGQRRLRGGGAARARRRKRPRRALEAAPARPTRWSQFYDPTDVFGDLAESLAERLRIAGR